MLFVQTPCGCFEKSEKEVGGELRLKSFHSDVAETCMRASVGSEGSRAEERQIWKEST